MLGLFSDYLDLKARVRALETDLQNIGRVGSKFGSSSGKLRVCVDKMEGREDIEEDVEEAYEEQRCEDVECNPREYEEAGEHEKVEKNKEAVEYGKCEYGRECEKGEQRGGEHESEKDEV